MNIFYLMWKKIYIKSLISNFKSLNFNQFNLWFRIYKIYEIIVENAFLPDDK